MEFLLNRPLPINTTQSTGSAAIFTLVGGLVVSKLKFHIYVINPGLAQAFAQAGYTRQQLRTAIAERARKYSYDWQNDKQQGDAVPFPDPYTQTPSERPMFVAAVTPDEINVVVGGGEAPQMGQCVSISSRSPVGQPLVTKKIRLPA